jgi:transposase-like protein
MPEIDRVDGDTNWIDLGFVEREVTPKPLMKLSIQLHSAKSSISDTVSILEDSDIELVRSTIHNWVQKANLQPIDGKKLDHVAIDESVIQLNDQRFWLYAAVNSDTNKFLHVRLFPARRMALTEQFLAELRAKHTLDDAVFLVDGAPWLHAALDRHGLRFEHETHGDRNPVERVFKELKRRTNQFEIIFATSPHPLGNLGFKPTPSCGIS